MKAPRRRLKQSEVRGAADQSSVLCCKRLLVACFALAVLQFPKQACAQFTDPRKYENTPVGTHQLELSYAYVHANASIDTSLIIAGARFNLNQGTITYTRYFGFLHRLMWVEAGIPVAGLGGSISGTNIQGSTIGAGDSSYALAMLLKGGPALSVAQFERYQPTTTLGVRLTITASGFWTRTRTCTSTPTTLLFMEGRSWGNNRYPDLKDTSAILLTTASGLLLIRATPFAAPRSSTASLRAMHNRISSSAVR